MKKSTLFLVAALSVFTACENEKDLYEPPATPAEIVSKYVMTEGIEVPIQEGQITIGTMGGEVIYEGNIPMTIQVPKFGMNGLTRAEAITWGYAPEIPNSGWYAKYKEWGVLMFEDLTIGDTDYNDFVCGVVHEIGLNGIDGKGKFNASLGNVRVKPMAMGNEIDMKFGVEYRRANGEVIQEIMITEDVRSFYFGNTQGYINTQEDGVLMDGIRDLAEKPAPTGTWMPKEVSAGDMYTLWFIESQGIRRYAANAGTEVAMSMDLMKGDVITNDGVPFGLFIPDSGLANKPGDTNNQPWKPAMYWAKETKSIFEAYPNFKPWTEGKTANPFAGAKTELLFDKSKVNF